MIRLIIGAGLGLVGGIAAVAMKRANKKADEDGREWVSYGDVRRWPVPAAIIPVILGGVVIALGGFYA